MCCIVVPLNIIVWFILCHIKFRLSWVIAPAKAAESYEDGFCLIEYLRWGIREEQSFQPVHTLNLKKQQKHRVWRYPLMEHSLHDDNLIQTKNNQFFKRKSISCWGLKENHWKPRQQRDQNATLEGKLLWGNF